jgi:hypothetical protein
MKFIKYLTEAGGYKEQQMPIEDFISLMKKDCSKYLKETKGNWFMRSVNYGTDAYSPLNMMNVVLKSVRKDRRPLGMDPKVFEKFNKWLSKNGHADRSKSISCSKYSGLEFGNPHFVFIKGNYKYTWLKGEDINVNDSKTGWKNIYPDVYFDSKNYTILPKYGSDFEQEVELSNFNYFPEEEERIEKKYRDLSIKWLDENFKKFFTTNKNMMEAWKNRYEIWFETKEYYLVHNSEKSKLFDIQDKLK